MWRTTLALMLGLVVGLHAAGQNATPDRHLKASFNPLNSPFNPGVGFSPDGKFILIRNVAIYDASTLKLVRTINAGGPPTRGPCLTRDGKHVIGSEYTSPKESLTVWNFETGKLEARIPVHEKVLRRIAIDRDGLLAAVIPTGANSIYLVDLKVKKTVAILQGHGEGEGFSLEDIAFSPDGKLLASATPNERSVSIWDVEKRKEIRTLHGADLFPMMVSWSRDSKVLATLSFPGNIHLWDARTGDLITNFSAPVPVNVIAFSPKEDMIALAGGDRPSYPVLFWRMATKEFTWCWGHTNSIECLAFSPDGKLLATGSRDQTVKIWEVPGK